MPVRGIILIAFVVGSLPACFFRPFYGLLLWTFIALLDPQWYTFSAARAMPWAMAVAIPTLAGLLVFGRGWTQRFMSRELFLLLILWVWFTITSFVSTSRPIFVPHAADTWERWEFVSKVLLMSIATIAIVDSFARLRTFLVTVACCFGVVVLKAIPFFFRTGGGERLYGPPNGMMADNNDFGLALDMTLPIFFFLAQNESNVWWKRFFWLLFFCAIPAIFFTYSRGAMLGLVVVAGMMILTLKRRWLLLPALAVGLMIALLFTPESWKERMDPTRPDAIDSSALSRLNAWKFSWRLALDYPVAGGGFETFTPELFERYGATESAPHGPHSVYFGVLAEHGFVGLFVYMAFVGSCLLTTRTLLKEARFRGDQAVINYAQMLRFSMFGFLTAGAFLGRAYFDYFFTIIACLLILKRLCQIEMEQGGEHAYSDGDGVEASERSVNGDADTHVAAGLA